MATIETRCPHCHRQSQIGLIARVAEGPYPLRNAGKTGWGAAFQSLTVTAAKAARASHDAKKKDLTEKLLKPGTTMERMTTAAKLKALGEQPPEPVLAAFAGQCGFLDCGGPALIVAVIQENADSLLRPSSDSWATLHLQAFTGGAFEVSAIFPPSSALQVHPAWPEIARTHLPELVEDLARNREPARILAGTRTVLDIILKDLLGKDMPKGRSSAIELLRDKGLATESLAHWAKQLWKDGSDASHDAKGERAQASAYLDFLKVLLQIAYVLPAEIDDLRKKDPLLEILG